MNRGSTPIGYRKSPFGIASMRPRFMNRGSPPVFVMAVPIPPCFNEAPIHESGK